MADETSTEAGAMDVMNNPENPSHEALHNESHVDHARVKSLVESMFAKANPQRDAIIRGVDNQEDAAQPADSQIDPVASYQQTDEEIQCTESLKSEWGKDYDRNIKDGGEFLRAMFPEPAAFENFIWKSGILHDAETMGECMRLCAKIGARMRGGR